MILGTFALLVQLLPASLALNSSEAFRIAGRVWLVWAVCWLAMAFFRKSTKRSESIMQRLGHLLPMALSFTFVFKPGFGGAWLAQRVLPADSPLLLLGVAVVILGLLFTVWARLALGSNWSGTVTIKKNHLLVRRGPYRFIRHPIYTGMLAAFLASVVIQGLRSGLLGFAFGLLAFYRKARIEENFLSQEFGEAFVEHRQHTGMFLPRSS